MRLFFSITILKYVFAKGKAGIIFGFEKPSQTIYIGYFNSEINTESLHNRYFLGLQG